MAALPVTFRGISSKNRRLLASLSRSMTGPFTTDEAAAHLSLTIPRTHRLLAHLAEGGWLVRVCRGLYAPVPLDVSDPGAWQEDPWIVAAKLFGPNYYIGGWTACEHWSLTEQIFLDTIVVTTHNKRNKNPIIQGLPYRLKCVPDSKVFGTNSVWRERIRVNISDPSRTLVDILDGPSLGGGIRQVAEVADTYFGGEYRDDKRLADYVGQAGNRVVFKRLGYLLETLGIRAPRLLQTCEASVSSGISRLDPSLPDQGPIAWRWKLRVNGAVWTERSFS